MNLAQFREYIEQLTEASPQGATIVYDHNIQAGEVIPKGSTYYARIFRSWFVKTGTEQPKTGNNASDNIGYTLPGTFKTRDLAVTALQKKIAEFKKK